MKLSKKTFKATVSFLAVILLAAFICFYAIFFSKNVKNNSHIIVIQPNSTFADVLYSLRVHNTLKSEKTFEITAKTLKYKKIRIGKYDISDCSNNIQLVRKLRRGQHYPVRFTFNNVRTKEQMAEKVAGKFFFEPAELLKLLNDENFLKKYDLNGNTSITLFIPNTYEIFYDITAEDFVEQMHKFHEQFWTAERREKAKEIGLSPIDVATLASIVEEENSRASEKAIIAGLYINRLRKGMLLQSDPTVKYAVGDFSRRRILKADLQVDSPYNTYKHQGLPPGPIRIPEASTMDSVLHYRHHDYLYMCAKEDFSGYHNFTGSAAVHSQNAARYRAALNRRNIRN